MSSPMPRMKAPRCGKVFRWQFVTVCEYDKHGSSVATMLDRTRCFAVMQVVRRKYKESIAFKRHAHPIGAMVVKHKRQTGQAKDAAQWQGRAPLAISTR